MQQISHAGMSRAGCRAAQCNSAGNAAPTQKQRKYNANTTQIQRKCNALAKHQAKAIKINK